MKRVLLLLLLLLLPRCCGCHTAAATLLLLPRCRPMAGVSNFGLGEMRELLGLATIAGGVASGNAEVAQAGQGIMAGSQGFAQRNFLTYARGMESSADQAALGFLKATQQSARGMINLFEKLASENIAVLADVDPYVMSHPMPM